MLAVLLLVAMAAVALQVISALMAQQIRAAVAVLETVKLAQQAAQVVLAL